MLQKVTLLLLLLCSVTERLFAHGGPGRGETETVNLTAQAGEGREGSFAPALCPAFSTQAPLSDEARERNICAGRGFCSKMGCRQEASCSRPAMKSAAGWRSDGKPSVGLEGFKLIASWQELLSRRGKPLKASMRLRICVVCCSFLILPLPKPGLAGSRLVKPFGFRAP